MAKADDDDAYKRLPMLPGNDLLDVAVLRSPADGEWYGFVRKTQLFGFAAAGLHCISLSRIEASSDCRILKVPRVGNYDVFGMITQLADLQAFADLKIMTT